MSKSEQLKKIEEEAKKCKKCPLWKTRKNVVFGMGNPETKILFIGEAPGYNEDLKGIPFCGKAGEVLDLLFSSISMKREDIYITNIIKCRPPGNRDPKEEEIEKCREYLEKQIEIINPEIICCLGRHALKYIFKKYSIENKKGISAIHGKVFEKRDIFSTIKIVAFYHPAVAVYNPEKLKILKEDFKILKEI